MAAVRSGQHACRGGRSDRQGYGGVACMQPSAVPRHCQDIIFLNLYFDQFHAPSLNIFPLTSLTISLFPSRLHD